MQARLYIFTSITYLNDGMTNGELEILAYIRVEAHGVDILNGLILPCLLVETHGLGSTPAHSFTGTQRTLLHYGMREQFGPPGIVKLIFPLELEQVFRPRYLQETPHCSLTAFR